MLPADQQLNRLKAMRNSGVLRSEVDGTVIQYRTMAEIERAIEMLAAEVNGGGGIVTRQASYSRGAI